MAPREKQSYWNQCYLNKDQEIHNLEQIVTKEILERISKYVSFLWG